MTIPFRFLFSEQWIKHSEKRFRAFLYSLFFLMPFSILGQEHPCYVQNFGGQPLNLTASARDRSIREDSIFLPHNFSGVFQVRAEDDNEEYEFFSIESQDKSLKWEIGKQINGAWYWKGNISNARYDYLPTVFRQPIVNTYHTLAFTYNAAKREVWLYYNGLNVAIYHIPEYSGYGNARVRLRFGGTKKGEGNQEWNTFNGYLNQFQLYDSVLSPEAILRLSKNHVHPNSHFSDQFKVMTFNIWHGGRETGKYVGPQRVAEVIHESGADVVTMQETYGSGALIADLLGYYFYLRSDNLSIMSRFPITETLDAYAPFYSGAAIIETGSRKVAIATTWLNYPIDYWDNLEKGVQMKEGDWLRQQEGNARTLQAVLEKLKPAIDGTDEIPLILCGDFNSGSHRDWVPSTRNVHHGYVMPFPATKLIESYGFTDSYRHIHPNPSTDPGNTWSPVISSAFPDRIDYIFYKGNTIRPIESDVIKAHPVSYPSDHAAVITVFEFIE